MTPADQVCTVSVLHQTEHRGEGIGHRCRWTLNNVHAKPELQSYTTGVGPNGTKAVQLEQ